MTHRLKTAHPSQHVEGDSYLNKLLKKEKTTSNARPRPSSATSRKERSGSGSRQSTTSTTNQVAKMKSTAKQQNLDLPTVTRTIHPVANVVHKESISDNSALVEVTVKTKKKSKTRSSNNSPDREPWDRLLKNNSKNTNLSLFNNFDPLRTIHFLAKELGYKLQSEMPDDSNVLQMVSDMQQAIKRIPPEIASTIQMFHPVSSKSKKSQSVHLLTDEEPEKLIQVIKPSLAEKHSQTPSNSNHNQEETEKIQKIMEESTLKLEASCRQMEMLCGRLKSEKDDLEIQLKNEKETVRFLKKRVDHLEEQNDNLLNVELKSLTEDKEMLERQIELLKKEKEEQEARAATELKHALQEIRSQKDKTEEECSNLKRDLAISRLEKEKYLAILAVRDQQICEIKMEMDQLQQVIGEQLRELNTNALSNMPSSESVVTNPSESWLYENPSNKEQFKKSSETFSTRIQENDSNLHLLKKPPSSFKELPSGDSGMIQDILENGLTSNSANSQKSDQVNGTSSNKLNNLPENTHASIRDMFAEVKKQAYAVASSPDQTISHSRYGSKKSLHQ